MKHRTAALSGGLFLAAACSLINSPEDLKPVEPIDTAGTTNGGTTGGTHVGEGGGDAGASRGGSTVIPVGGMGGCSDDCCGDDCGAGGMGGESGAPPIGRDCDDSAADCGLTAPICDGVEGKCRACAIDKECSDDLGLDYCSTTGVNKGRCVACKTDDDCSGNKPVCGPLGQCRACTAHSDCASHVCAPTGECTVPERVVYQLAVTGNVDNNTCGTIDKPCRNLSAAVSKLSGTRPTLVILETNQTITEGTATFAAVPGGMTPFRVIGNGVVIHPYTNLASFIVPAGVSVLFEDVVLEGTTGNMSGEDANGNPVAAVQCTGGQIVVQDSVLRNNVAGIRATDCDVTVSTSLIEKNAVAAQFGAAGIVAKCTTNGCLKKLEVRRNRFVDNGVAASNGSQAEATYENNLFLRNGAAGYTRVIELRAQHTRFAYNTLVENFNSCTYVGIVACNAGTCDEIGNISYGSFPDEMTPCYDQVWYGGSLSYSLTEIPYPGVTNKSGDPLFVDAAKGDFTPGPGSPALDKGNPDDAPTFDIDGQPRPAKTPDMGAFEAQ